ncbi:hypothetical protein GCM10025771_01390 [Niveibacterium umoris]
MTATGGWRTTLLGRPGSLGRRITLLTMAVGTALTLLASSIQLTLDYLELRRGLDRQLDQIELYLPNIALSIWNLDEDQVRLALAGLTRQPNVRYVQVATLGMKYQWAQGERPSRNAVVRTFSIKPPSSRSGEAIGELTVVASLDGLFWQIGQRALVILLSFGLIAILLAAFMLMLTRRLITGRLDAIGDKVASLGEVLSAGEQPVDLPSHKTLETVDELGMLERTLDRTTMRLTRASEEITAAQAALAESESRFRTLVEQAPEAICVFRADGQWRFLDVNPSAVRLFGCASREALLATDVRSFFDVQQPDGRSFEETARSRNARTLAGESSELERAMRTADGRLIYCNVHLSPMPETDPPLIRVTCIDVTERRQAEAAAVELSTRLQAVLDAAHEVSIISTDAQGAIRVFNRGAEAMLGYSAAEMIGQTPAVFHRESEVRMRARELTAELGQEIDGFETFVALARRGQSETRNWTYVRKDGQPLRVSLTVSAVCDAQGAIVGFLGVARDITQQLAAEGDLIRLNLQLDGRVRERTKALQESTERLQAALDDLQHTQVKLVQAEKLAALGSLVAAIAHQLNTPIGNCLITATALSEETAAMRRQLAEGAPLKRSSFTQYVDTAGDTTELIVRSLQRAAALVAHFKQIAVDQRHERSEFDLAEAVTQAIAIARASCNGARFDTQIEVPPGLRMEAYPTAVEQVISDLVSNAVLHAFSGRDHGTMRVAARQDGENVVLSFSDDGCGMGEDIRRRVFDPFFTTGLARGHTGLGLSICYNLVTGPLGGQMEVSSTPGVGTVFTLTLPRKAPEPVSVPVLPGQ